MSFATKDDQELFRLKESEKGQQAEEIKKKKKRKTEKNSIQHNALQEAGEQLKRSILERQASIA